LLAPYLVILVTLVTLWRHLPRIYCQGGLPFILGFMGVLYGYLVGLIQSSPIPVTIALLEWLVPLLFGFHLFVNWRDYPSYRQNIQHTFVWGVLLMGVYGVIQYLVAPEWDRFWLTNTEMISAGSPEPLQIRVWSTMHAPGIFGFAMMTGLLLLFTYQSSLSRFVSVMGYLAFLLSSARSAWVSWLVGLLTHISSLKPNFQIRVIVTIMVLSLGVIPLTTIEPFSDTINSRLETLSNLENDHSSNERNRLYRENIDSVLTNYLGNGIEKQAVLDSGILDIFFSLGWFGGIFYLGGMFQNSTISFDPFFSIARSLGFSLFISLVFGRQQTGAIGVMLWGFLGIGMAASKYYYHQLNAASQK
jgi:hypothetical protein